jgi:4-aminobutyrate aminotransferase-like enzyme
MTANRRAVMAGVKAMSTLLVERLTSLPFAQPDTISVGGLAIGVDVKNERRAERIRSSCRRRGLLLTTQGSTLLLLPPLTIDAAVAQPGLDILEVSAREGTASHHQNPSSAAWNDSGFVLRMLCHAYRSRGECC